MQYWLYQYRFIPGINNPSIFFLNFFFNGDILCTKGAGNWFKFLCLLEIQLHKQMSAKSLPMHWLCLWSIHFWSFSIHLWNQRGVCAPGHLQVLYEQFHWAPSCPHLTSWTSPRPCWHYLLDLGGRYSVLLYFFLMLEWCWGYNPYSSCGGDSLGVRGSRITWVLCFLHSWHKGMDLGKKPKDLSSLPVLLGQTRITKSTSMEHLISILLISAFEEKGVHSWLLEMGLSRNCLGQCMFAWA